MKHSCIYSTNQNLLGTCSTRQCANGYRYKYESDVIYLQRVYSTVCFCYFLIHLIKISRASKVMFKILQARLQQYMNCELPDVQAGFRKGGGTRDQIANIRWIMEKAREFQKNVYFCFIDYAKAFDCVDHKKLWKILKEMGIPDHLTCLLKTCMQVRKQQLELDMEQQTGSKQEKECVKAVYYHPAYLTYIQTTS